MSSLKLCVNCRFVDRQYSMKFAKCTVPICSSQDHVSGKVNLVTTYCSVHRKCIDALYCGPQAKWYEPKPIGFFGSLLKRFTK